jgi:dihydroxyacetone kinase-like predicted kinase
MFLTPTTDVDSVSDIVEVDGKSIVITRGPTESQVHVHLDNPQELLNELGESFQVTDVQIELLDSQKQSRKVVAQAFGHSLVQFLAEQAVQVVAAEPNHRPSVQDFVAAGLKANAPEILLLPSDADSIVVANLAAAELKHLDIAAFVIPTQSLPQTLASLSVFDSSSALPELISEMTTAAESVKTIAVTQAVRDANTSVGSVKQFDWLWLVDNLIFSSSEDFDSGLSQLESHFKNAELITVLAGEAASVSDRENLINWLQKTNPDAEIQQIPGNQKIWHFIIGVE